MPMAKLTTKRAVDDLPRPEEGQVLYWCTEMRGFGVVEQARLVGEWRRSRQLRVQLQHDHPSPGDDELALHHGWDRSDHYWLL